MDPLEVVPRSPGIGVLCWEASDDFGVTVWLDLALLGVDLVMVGLRESPPRWTLISEGTMASAQGLLEGASVTVLFPALLSLLLSRILFGSPLT